MAATNTNQKPSTGADNRTELEKALAGIEYAPVREMISEKFAEVVKLINANNARVAKIQEANSTDPNNPEHLDNVWRRVIAEGINDAEMIKAEERYQIAQAESEKQLKVLREAAKARHIRPAMSDKEQQETRKLINEGKAVIQTAKAAAEAIASMADQLLENAKKPVEGGIISLLPEAKSLLNTRGRRANTTFGDKPYSTRIIDAKVNGVSANKTKKVKGREEESAHFNNIADFLSREFGGNTFPENVVTSEEVEHAYYDSKNVAWREATEMPEVHTFEFTKEIKVQNPNDDSTKVEPKTVKIEVTRWTKDAVADNSNEPKNEEPKEKAVAAKA